MGIRVLLADDHALFRNALHMTLALEPDIDVVAEAGDGTAVMQIVASTAVDVVCMDIRMAGQDGLETTRQLHRQFPGVRVIGLSACDDPTVAESILSAGASSYVLKMNVGRKLSTLIRQVHRDEILG